MKREARGEDALLQGLASAVLVRCGRGRDALDLGCGRLDMADYIEHPSKASRLQAGTYVVHPEAMVEDSTVWIPLGMEADGVQRWEGLLGIRLAADTVRVCAVPVFAYDINLGDEVHVMASGEGALVATRKSLDAGNYTFRVYFENGLKDDSLWRGLLCDLEAMNCWFDVYSQSLVAISAPPAHAQAVADYLYERQIRGGLHYETGRQS